MVIKMWVFVLPWRQQLCGRRNSAAPHRRSTRPNQRAARSCSSADLANAKSGRRCCSLFRSAAETKSTERQFKVRDANSLSRLHTPKRRLNKIAISRARRGDMHVRARLANCTVHRAFTSQATVNWRGRSITSVDLLSNWTNLRISGLGHRALGSVITQRARVKVKGVLYAHTTDSNYAQQVVSTC